VTGDVILFAMGTGNYDELICKNMIDLIVQGCRAVYQASNSVDLLVSPAVRDTLEAIIDALIDMTKSQPLTDLVLFQHYFILVHILDEVCKEVCLGSCRFSLVTGRKVFHI